LPAPKLTSTPPSCRCSTGTGLTFTCSATTATTLDHCSPRRPTHQEKR
jgi:hypothetical protein